MLEQSSKVAVDTALATVIAATILVVGCVYSQQSKAGNVPPGDIRETPWLAGRWVGQKNNGITFSYTFREDGTYEATTHARGCDDGLKVKGTAVVTNKTLLTLKPVKVESTPPQHCLDQFDVEAIPTTREDSYRMMVEVRRGLAMELSYRDPGPSDVRLSLSKGLSLLDGRDGYRMPSWGLERR